VLKEKNKKKYQNISNKNTQKIDRIKQNKNKNKI